MDVIEIYIQEIQLEFPVEYTPTEIQSDQARQSKINKAEAYVKEFLRFEPAFFIDEIARSKLTARLSDPKFRFRPETKV